MGGANYLGTLGAGASVSGGSLVLTGSASSYMQIPSSVLSGLSSMTFEMWVSTSASSNGNVWDRIFTFGTDICFYVNGACIYLQKNEFSGGIMSQAYTGPTSGLFDSGSYLSSPPFDGLVNAHIVVAIVGGISKQLYVNNVAAASDSCIPIPTVNKFLLGNSFDFSSGMAGSITEFRIYSGVLSAAQISANYAAGPTSPSPSPTLSPSTSKPSSPMPSSSTVTGRFEISLTTDYYYYQL